jgi:hypothetical protein
MVLPTEPKATEPLNTATRLSERTAPPVRSSEMARYTLPDALRYCSRVLLTRGAEKKKDNDYTQCLLPRINLMDAVNL